MSNGFALAPNTVHADLHSRRETTVRIEPATGFAPAQLGELWTYRELVWFLTLRDLKVRYKQTAVGALWAVIQPVMQMIVFSLFMGKVAGLDNTTTAPYPLMLYCGLLPWMLFTSALTTASNSLVGNERLVSKVYFPRLIIPTASMAARLVDFLISFGVLIVMLLIWGSGLKNDPKHPYHIQQAMTPALLALPLFVLFTMLVAAACSLWLSAANVRFRDVGYIIPFILQLMSFATPVYYESSLAHKLNHAWSFLFELNPMTSVCDGFRWALLGEHPPEWTPMLISLGGTLLVLFLGLIYFRRAEETFADVI